MNILFWGFAYPKEMRDYYIGNMQSDLQMAPATFCANMLEGFRQIDGVRSSMLSMPAVGSFPFNFKSPIIPHRIWGDGNIQIGYLNFPCIKRIIQTRKLVSETEKKILEHGAENICIVIYSPYLPFLKSLNILKRKYPDLRSCMIVTDCIPGKGDMPKFMTRRAKRRGDLIVKYAKKLDCFALLTQHLKDALEIDSAPFVITECICNEKIPISKASETSKNRCLYTGTLEFEYGIKDMVDAFARLDDAELWICGSGEAQNYIEQIATVHKNIRFFGFLAKDELEQIRNECDFLINPRRPVGTYTKYSFPSKTAEYMMSAKPVIMYKLEGVPDEYDGYLNYISSASIEGICDELSEIFKSDYRALQEKALCGREYVINNKSSKKQAQKIVSMLNSI